MSDPASSRPRLVSMGDDGNAPPAEPEAQEPAGPTVRRRLLWLVLALTLVIALLLVVQTEKVLSLEARNSALAGELFTARAALEAYAARFMEVRETVGGLQAQLERLSVLVSEDPVASEPVAPAAGADPATPPD